MIEAIDDYLIRCSRRRDIEGNPKPKVPTLEGICVVLRTTMYHLKKWMAENEDLKIKLDFLIAIQVSLILDKGLTSNNYVLQKLLLNQQGYTDKSEQSVNVKTFDIKKIIIENPVPLLETTVVEELTNGN